ncbi:MAG: hypothetical protein HOQ02_08895 [Lysobacter sp.]|nr:hypothetical protein [Lysobacter sp.]
MNAHAADARIDAWRHATRRHRAAVVASFALPWLCATLMFASRAGSLWAWCACAVLATAALVLAWRAARRIDDAWLAHRLDARRPDMEDSASLLFARGTLSPLQALQRERLRVRVQRAPAVELRDAWPRRALAASTAAALLVFAIALWWPAGQASTFSEGIAAPTGNAATPRLASMRLDIQPPTYTGLPARSVATLDASIPEGAVLRWTLRFSTPPRYATLRVLDGRDVALQRDGDDWHGEVRVARSMLYRIVLDAPLPRAQSGLHRIDVRADAAPVLRVLEPRRNLSVHAPGQRIWPLAFEADDDHGLAPAARIELVQTQGTGENITTRQSAITLAGVGAPRHRRWTHALDLGALGLSPGDDVIVRFVVADNRAPQPHVVRSPSFILRWPPETTSEASGMDGLVRTTLPAYLRSQRQVIIDAETLLKQRRALDAAPFLKRSNALGDDQQALRLRYGQFLGEESEGAPKLPTSDLPTSDAPAADTHAHAGNEGAPLPAPPPKFGEAGDVLGDFGHVHDSPEAATLLDPDTKEILRAALRQMWESELHLRQGDPAAALPFAYKALGFIKQVQQATRIYLARTGSEPPPVDESRRLTGKREGLGDRADVLAQATPADPLPARAWQALQDTPDAARTPLDIDALERWVRTRGAHGSDPLALIAAIDAVRQSPACVACRARLRSALWPLLPQPPATTAPRARPDAGGAAYLDALDRSGAR